MAYIYAFFASFGFAVLYNIRGRLLLFTAFGGALGQLVFDFSTFMGLPLNYFVATTVLGLYSEIMARLTKVPVMLYLIVGVLPIVPGAGVYRTTLSLFKRDTAGFVMQGNETLMAAGAIALAIIIVSSIIRIFKLRHFPFLMHHKKSKYRPNMK